MIPISHIDHLVMTVANISLSIAFYKKVLGMEIQQFSEGRTALQFGNQKINLHQKGKEFEPKALHPSVGAIDLCFITEMPLKQVIVHLDAMGIAMIEKEVFRTGAIGEIQSVYIRDPDGNLIEISNY